MTHDERACDDIALSGQVPDARGDRLYAYQHLPDLLANIKVVVPALDRPLMTHRPRRVDTAGAAGPNGVWHHLEDLSDHVGADVVAPQPEVDVLKDAQASASPSRVWRTHVAAPHR